MVNFTSRPLYPRERAPDTQWIGGWVGHKASLNVVARIYPSPCQESNPSHPAYSLIIILTELLWLIVDGIHTTINFWSCSLLPERAHKSLRFESYQGSPEGRYTQSIYNYQHIKTVARKNFVFSLHIQQVLYGIFCM